MCFYKKLVLLNIGCLLILAIPVFSATKPTITTQPVSKTVNAGQTATFSVVATGTATLKYQWLKNNTNVSGATSASYTTPTTIASDNGAKFTCFVSNSAGNITSNAAILTVNSPPSITTQPANKTVNVGQTATFSVVATGTATLKYQWLKNNANVSGATSASYTTPTTIASDNGAKFTCKISNGFGTITSSTATLTVNTTLIAPTNLVATIISTNQINLNWTDNSSNESGFAIERKAGADINGIETFVQVATVGANIRSYNDRGLVDEVTYTYRVKAYNSIASSTYSNSISATTSSSTAGLRIVLDVNLWGWMGDWRNISTSDNSYEATLMRFKLGLLDYYKKLGYTHVYCNVSIGATNYTGGHWVYNNGNYTTDAGDEVVSSFQYMKSAVESKGLQVIPLLSSLSHMDGYIKVDPSISEFYDVGTKKSTWSTMSGKTINGTYIRPEWDHVAYAGNYPDVRNVPMDEIVSEEIKIVNANWGNTAVGGPFPKYINIGHDEEGAGSVCFIAADRNKSLLSSYTKSDLVAREIAYRYQQIQNTLKIRGAQNVKVILWGDSFLPADYGVVYDMCGNLNSNGSGGVLDKIKNDTYIKSKITNNTSIFQNIIVSPWMYSFPDNYFWRCTGSTSPISTNDVKFDKKPQIAYLNNLGYKFIPFSGTDGSISDPNAVERIKQNTYEWVRNCKANTTFLAGYGNAVWDSRYNWDNVTATYVNNPNYFSNINDTANSLKTEFSATLLAYTAWTYQDMSYYVIQRVYSPIFYNNCKFLQSRNTLSWVSGTDYTPFVNQRNISQYTSIKSY
jgi:hypothetical protein